MDVAREAERRRAQVLIDSASAYLVVAKQVPDNVGISFQGSMDELRLLFGVMADQMRRTMRAERGE